VTEDLRTKSVAEAMEYLRNTARLFLPEPYCTLCLRASTDYDKGYGGAWHPYAYEGGLAVHVADVVRRCWQMCRPEVNVSVLLTAAYWHDHCKLLEYRANPDGKVSYTAYAKQIGHVVGSVLAFSGLASNPDPSDTSVYYYVPAPERNAIIHCMLTHHGRKEWGSPVEPTTIEAYILHSVDMLSSRAAAE